MVLERLGLVVPACRTGRGVTVMMHQGSCLRVELGELCPCLCVRLSRVLGLCTVSEWCGNDVGAFVQKLPGKGQG